MDAVLFGSTPGTLLSENDTLVVARAPANSVGLHNVTVVGSTGSQVTAHVSWQQVPPGAIDSANPSSGIPLALVTITGSELLGIGTSAQRATVGGSQAAAIVSSNASVVVLRVGVVPPAPTTSITIEADTGDLVTQDGLWTFEPLPNVTSVTPSEGQQGTRSGERR